MMEISSGSFLKTDSGREVNWLFSSNLWSLISQSSMAGMCRMKYIMELTSPEGKLALGRHQHQLGLLNFLKGI
jgi:hypothetical protein